MNNKINLVLFAATLPLPAIALAESPDRPMILEPSRIVSEALPLTADQHITPVIELDGDELMLRKESSIGATLDGLPGISAASFGPGASRPVIRGLDGARVKVLSNGTDTLDASTVSQDHAVAVEPLLAERIEVLRGPATLLYGGGAIGGVVNVIDQRVPTHVPAKGYEGAVELRGNTAARESAGVMGLTAGSGPFAVRVEGARLRAEDYRIPGSGHRQNGSYNDTDNYSLGGSLVGERGYLGVAFSRQENRYGLLSHEHVSCDPHGDHWHCGEHGHHHGHEHDHSHDHDHDEHEAHDHGVPFIRMKQDRWDVRGELSDPLPGFTSGRLRVSHSDYRHKEIEGGVSEATFDNLASEARVELVHQPLGGWEGVIGGQTSRRDFSRWTPEHPMPDTLTRNHALFVLESYETGDWRYELGARHEWQTIDADTAKDTSHRATSFSTGAIWSFAPEYSLGLSLSRSQRLPTAEELYAYGPHAASRTIERGNVNLDEETSHNVELTLRKHTGVTTFSVSLYRNQVNDFIYAADLGRQPGGGYREVEWQQQDAVLTGVEGELRYQLSDLQALTFFGDHVRARFRHGDGDLPRIPATRFGIRLDRQALIGVQGLDGQLELQRVQRQNDVADHETETAGYNMLKASLVYSGALDRTDYQLFLKADNLLNEKARQHSSMIKDDVLLPGRNLTAGIRLSF